MTRTKAFLSYSHVDREWQERLVTHLAVLQRKELLDVWVDTAISVGDTWAERIDAELARCRVAILLVSPNFLASPFIQGVEVQRLLQRHAQDGLRLIPLIARPCAWKLVDWLARLQCRPEGGRALSVGTEAAIDLDLEMFTYYIGELLGELEPEIVDGGAQMADSAPEQHRGGGAEFEPLPRTPNRQFGGSWQGTYKAVPGGYEQRMLLAINRESGGQFWGRGEWPKQAATTDIEGEISEVPSVDAQAHDVWTDVANRVPSPQMFVRFTDTGKAGAGSLQLNGDYRAALATDGTLSGLWYPTAQSVTPIGQFVLMPVRDGATPR